MLIKEQLDEIRQRRDAADIPMLLKHIEEVNDILQNVADKLLVLAYWREHCHDYDADMGYELRMFDEDDVVNVEEYAQEILTLCGDGLIAEKFKIDLMMSVGNKKE